MGMADNIDQQTPAGANPGKTEAEPPQGDRALVKKILRRIKNDKQHHEDAFKRMRRDMFIAMNGRDESWHQDNYAANIAGRHVKQKTNALYAKNPKSVARRRETIDFAVWDENPQSLMLAFQTIQMAQAAVAAAPPAVDPAGNPMMGPDGGPVTAQPQLPPGFAEAQALIADFQQGMARRTQAAKMGKTLEILYAYFLREQKPVDFKMGMKQLVRRTCTTCVGYVELGFQREYGPRPNLSEQLADSRQRLEHLRHLVEEAQEGEIDDMSAEAAELEKSIASLQAEKEIVIREGLIFDFLQSTKVIPDMMTKSLVGFIGARHLTLEYLFTADEVEEMFPDAQLEGKYTGYSADGSKLGEDGSSVNRVTEDGFDADGADRDKGSGLVCVYKHYDKPSGLVYFVAEGHDCFLRPAAAPDVFVEDFWPVYALTFNAVESEKELYPLSDVGLLRHMQQEYNRSRQGMREHREAARPRWGYAKGRLSEEDIVKLGHAKPFDVLALEYDGQTKLADILEPIPVPGVDPNLYGTDQYFQDVQFTVGSSEAQFGGIAQATATESAIAANSSAASDGSAVDDLDAFLTVIARAASQILLKEMSPERVTEIVGPGAVWPTLTLAEIADELYLETEAGSSGKPNQAVEINNWTKMLPFLIQMPGLDPMWLARETVRRLDDKLDLTEAIAAGMPSIVMQNQAKPPGTGDPASDPSAQGGQGAQNAPAGPAEQQPGSSPAFGSNQV